MNSSVRGMGQWGLCARWGAEKMKMIGIRLAVVAGAMFLTAGIAETAQAQRVVWKIWHDDFQYFEHSEWDSKADCELRVDNSNQLRESCVMVQVTDRTRSRSSKNNRHRHHN